MLLLTLSTKKLKLTLTNNSFLVLMPPYKLVLKCLSLFMQFVRRFHFQSFLFLLIIFTFISKIRISKQFPFWQIIWYGACMTYTMSIFANRDVMFSAKILIAGMAKTNITISHYFLLIPINI